MERKIATKEMAIYRLKNRYKSPKHIIKPGKWRVWGSMRIIGRKREKGVLADCLASGRPEFLVIYGRRRVGKTYLIKEFFNGQFSFYATGLSDGRMIGQLKAFCASLLSYGSAEKAPPRDWFEAFSRLRDLLERDQVYREPVSARRVVFLDELPWMDTPRSDFRSALEYFWNGWASSQADLLLIVCGSATSWMMTHLLKERRGFHNRMTRRLWLLPFSVGECEELLQSNDIVMTRDQILECFMVFGGIPYYLNMLDARLSLAQNIDELLFKPYGALRDEYSELFSSLFTHPEKHQAVIETLAKTKNGTTRTALAENPKIGSGSMLTKNLTELDQCGFIRKYRDYTRPSNDACYQLTDPFVLFCIRFIKREEAASWMSYLRSPSYLAWLGNAFEICCLNHAAQIKAALGIAGVETMEYAWRSKKTNPAAQIDLLIDRKDGVINLCEMKYTDGPYETDKEEYERLMNRIAVFQEETASNKALHLTLITANGLKNNKYAGIYQNVITGEELFL